MAIAIVVSFALVLSVTQITKGLWILYSQQVCITAEEAMLRKPKSFIIGCKKTVLFALEGDIIFVT